MISASGRGRAGFGMAITGTKAGCRRFGAPWLGAAFAAATLVVLAAAAPAQTFGLAGPGEGPGAPSLNVLVPDLSRLAERNGGEFPAGDVRDVIDGRALVVAHGPRTMPVWGYEFWIEEGADIEAEAAARELIERL